MNVYKLKSGKTSGAFQLPLRGILVPREIEGETFMKEIQYVPGSSSFYKEDHKGDSKPRPIWFDDGEIRVNPDDKVLNELLQNHPWFSSKFYLVNEEASAKEEINDFERITKASNSIINEKDNFRLKAMAMTVISLDASNWDPFKCKAELLKYAKNHSATLLTELDKANYEARFMSALAFAKGIVKHNEFQTAVLWNDEKAEIIVRVSEGEKGVDKLGDFLSTKSEKSTSVWQRIGEKVEALQANVVTEKTGTFVSTATAKTEAEIAEEAIERYKASQIPVKSEADIRAEILSEFGLNSGNQNTDTGNDVKKEDIKGYDSTDLDQVQAKYKELFGKDVANLKKNDLDCEI